MKKLIFSMLLGSLIISGYASTETQEAQNGHTQNVQQQLLFRWHFQPTSIQVAVVLPNGFGFFYYETETVLFSLPFLVSLRRYGAH